MNDRIEGKARQNSRSVVIGALLLLLVMFLFTGLRHVIAGNWADGGMMLAGIILVLPTPANVSYMGSAWRSSGEAAGGGWFVWQQWGGLGVLLLSALAKLLF